MFSKVVFLITGKVTNGNIFMNEVVLLLDIKMAVYFIVNYRLTTVNL